MAKSEYIRNLDFDTATRVCAEYKKSNSYPDLYVDASGNIELHGGNNNDRARARAFIEQSVAVAANPKLAGEPAATERQISYLKSLVKNDPAGGISLNLDAATIARLTKSEASRHIGFLSNY